VGVGIEKAAKHYYGKHSSELDVAQSAMIAGMLRAPSRYSPDLHPDKAKTRRDEVLTTMLSRGSITQMEAEAAMQSPVR
jgi:penicillin-binding protein 1A